ncbi:ELMO domain [Dillenia turbinata]|uniref:ELMO domain n=1 Tax=Dillenia turbinata TaxID=194707 RepID=A0AAN8UWR6_9MAGN
MGRLNYRECLDKFQPVVDEDEIYWRQKKEDEELAWSHNSSHLVSQLAQCFANAMVGPKAWIGGILQGNRRNGSHKFVNYTFNPIQEQRLHRLQERLQVPFDETRPDHQEALRALWHAAFPNVKLKGLISEQWKDMGWQGPNPSTDFRGCGFVSLENLLFFARTYPASFHRLLFKRDGMRAAWEYPFAVAGINISFMLIQMLDLSSEDEEAFDVLYCIAFEMMDAQWLAMRASYMEFNEVLQGTRTQLERELSLEDVNRIQDLPAYNLLFNQGKNSGNLEEFMQCNFQPRIYSSRNVYMRRIQVQGRNCQARRFESLFVSEASWTSRVGLDGVEGYKGSRAY